MGKIWCCENATKDVNGLSYKTQMQFRMYQWLPQRPVAALEDWEFRQVLLLVECPVPGSEGPGEHHLPQGRDEEHDPEQGEQVVELQQRPEMLLPILCVYLNFAYVTYYYFTK